MSGLSRLLLVAGGERCILLQPLLDLLLFPEAKLSVRTIRAKKAAQVDPARLARPAETTLWGLHKRAAAPESSPDPA